MGGIRQLAGSPRGTIIAAGEFEQRVHIWDVASGRHISTFDVALDYGGQRLAIPEDGQLCATAAYQRQGVAVYRTVDGARLWHRRDLTKAQFLRCTSDGNLAVFFDNRSAHILSRDTGETLMQARGVHEAYYSPRHPLALVIVGNASRRVQLRDPALQTVRWTQELIGFDVHDVTFTDDLAVVSEAAERNEDTFIRAFTLATGDEIWRWSPGETIRDWAAIRLSMINFHTLVAVMRVEPQGGGVREELWTLDVSSGTGQFSLLLSGPDSPAATPATIADHYLVLANGKVFDVGSGTPVLVRDLPFSNP